MTSSIGNTIAQPWIDRHELILEVEYSSKKEWVKEQVSNCKTVFFMENGTLNLCLKSGGGFSKPYKASLFKEEKNSSFDYTLLIKDLIGITEARLPTIVSIPIKPYVQTGSKVKFLMLGQGPMPIILGSVEIE